MVGTGSNRTDHKHDIGVFRVYSKFDTPLIPFPKFKIEGVDEICYFRFAIFGLNNISNFMSRFFSKSSSDWIRNYSAYGIALDNYDQIVLPKGTIYHFSKSVGIQEQLKTTYGWVLPKVITMFTPVHITYLEEDTIRILDNNDKMFISLELRDILSD